MQYICDCIDKLGKKVVQKLEGANEADVRLVLRSMSLRPIRIRKASATELDLGALIKIAGNNLSLGELVIFTRQLQVLVNSGIPLIQSLDILIEQVMPGTLKNVLLGMKERVSRGSYLWEALAAYPNAFPRLYVSLIKAGESSGSLDAILKRLSRYLEDNERLRKQVKGAMMYPIIVVCIGALVVAILLIFVIPKFEEMLKQNGKELPGPTKIVIMASHFLANNWWIILGGMAATSYIFTRYHKTEEGRKTIDRIVYRLPLFGTLTSKSGIARFCRTLQTLLMAGVSLLEAIEICKTTIGNVVLEEATGEIKKAVEQGISLGAALAKSPIFPKMTAQMIQVGESTGNLDKMLEKIADFFETDVESLVSGMSKMIEPLVLVVLGGTVGGILIAMYLPIFSLAGGGD